MDCSGCANNVKKKFESIDGVSLVEVNLEEKTALVEAEHILNTNDLSNALEETTYEVTDVKQV